MLICYELLCIMHYENVYCTSIHAKDNEIHSHCCLVKCHTLVSNEVKTKRNVSAARFLSARKRLAPRVQLSGKQLFTLLVDCSIFFTIHHVRSNLIDLLARLHIFAHAPLPIHSSSLLFTACFSIIVLYPYTHTHHLSSLIVICLYWSYNNLSVEFSRPPSSSIHTELMLGPSPTTVI